MLLALKQSLVCNFLIPPLSLILSMSGLLMCPVKCRPFRIGEIELTVSPRPALMERGETWDINLPTRLLLPRDHWRSPKLVFGVVPDLGKSGWAQGQPWLTRRTRETGGTAFFIDCELRYWRGLNICYLSSVSDTSKKPRSDFHIFTWDTWFLPVIVDPQLHLRLKIRRCNPRQE